MKTFSDKKTVGQIGAAMVEYAIGAALLMIVFIVAGKLLEQKSSQRFNNSARVIQGMAPCGPGGQLSGEECL